MESIDAIADREIAERKIQVKIDNKEIIVQCSGFASFGGNYYCGKIQSNGVWIRYDINNYKKVSHGMCPKCYGKYMRELDGEVN